MLKRFSYFLKPIIVPLLMLGALFVLAVPAVHAQTLTSTDLGLNTEIQQNIGLTATDIRVVIARIIRAALAFLGTLALILILYGGFVWMTAGGSEDKISTAKKIIINGTIGLAIILSSYAITSFIISKLVEATTDTVGGGPPSGCGASCPYSFAQFFVKASPPSGQYCVRNVRPAVVFNQPVDKATLTGNIVVKVASSGSVVPGVWDYGSNNATALFTPVGSCAPSLGNDCLATNTPYIFEFTNPANIKATFDPILTLDCTLGATCASVNFTSGDAVDRTPPVITITAPPKNSAFQIGTTQPFNVSYTDDNGVQSITLLTALSSGGQANVIGSVTSPSCQRTGSFTIPWNTTGFNPSDYTVTASGLDYAGQGDDDSGTYTLRPAHCFNSIQDADETGLNCGGASCGACAGGSCSANNQCASGQCVNGICITQMAIQSFSPPSGAPGTFVSVLGRYFGATPGRVYFGKISAPLVDADWVEAFPPPSCGPGFSYWNDNQIIVQAPTGTVASTPIKVVTAQFPPNELPNNGQLETDFPIGNVDMRGNTLLLHMNENWAGTGVADGVDSSGVSNIVRSYNGITSAAGKFNNAGSFTGYVSYLGVQATPNFEFTGTGAKTISLWINPKSGGARAGHGYILSKPWNGGGSYNYTLDMASYSVRFCVQSSNCINIGSLTPNQWAHLAVTIIDGNVKVYKDGVYVGSRSYSVADWAPGQYGNTGQWLAIGTLFPYGVENPLTQRNFTIDGKIDELAFFNRALSDTEIYNLKLHGDPVTQSDTTIAKNLNNFQVNSTIRPGICSLTPAAGAPGSPVSVIGKNFGLLGSMGDGVFFDTQSAVVYRDVSGVPAWSDSLIVVNTPGILAGDLSVKVVKNNIESNKVKFTVSPIDSGTYPVVSSVSPASGTAKEYITITGRNFGDNKGTVIFKRTQNDANPLSGDFSFPAACEDNLWDDTQVIVKAPTGLVPGQTYVVQVETANNVTSLFDTNQVFKGLSGVPSPGICAISPNGGPIPLPTGQKINIFGENFTVGVSGAYFWGAGVSNPLSITGRPLAAIDSANSSVGKLAVTPDPTSKTGPVSVYRTSDTKISNPVNFNVADCTVSGNSCEGNYQCCTAGGDKGMCIPNASVCSDSTRFTGYIWRFATKNIPQPPAVVERCDGATEVGNALPSPSPSLQWDTVGVSEDSRNVCKSAVVTMEFSAPLNQSTIIPATVRVNRCDSTTTGTVCNGPIEESLAPGSYTLKPAFGSVSSTHVYLQLKSTAPWEAGVYYQVSLGAGIASASSDPVLPLRASRSCGGNTAYCFMFRGGGQDCELRSVVVTPYKYFTNLLESPMTSRVDANTRAPVVYNGLGLSNQKCIMLDTSGFRWSWNSLNINYANIFGSGIGTTAQVSSLGNTVGIGLNNNSVMIQAQATTGTITKVGVSPLTIDLSDPKVTDWWPKCAEACSNAEVGLEFNTAMSTKNLTNAVKILKCLDENCLNTVDVTNIANLQLGLTPNLINIASGGLATDTIYKVTVSNFNPTPLPSNQNNLWARTSTDPASYGKPYNEQFTWRFRTKKSACAVSRVAIKPSSFTASSITDRAVFGAQPYSAPDSCSTNGQKLNPWAMDWDWSSSDVDVATIASFTTQGRNQACAADCTLRGSTIPSSVSPIPAGICGNGQVETGEDCDIGVAGENNVSCTLECLRPGNPSVGTGALKCGNGVVENARGEECDGGVGCSANCTNLGSSSDAGQALGAQPSLSTDGLVGWWTMDATDVTVTTATDKSGMGNNGRRNGGTVGITGKIGEAMNFNGSDGYITAGTSSLPVGTSPRTIALWMYQRTNNAQNSPVSMETTGGRSFTLSPLFSGGIYYIWTDSVSVNFTVNAADYPPLNRWNHYVISWDSSTLRYYLNGALRGSLAYSSTIGPLNVVQLGRRVQGAPGYFDGIIDDARIYNRALSATDVGQLYTLGGILTAGESFCGSGAVAAGEDCDLGITGVYSNTQSSLGCSLKCLHLGTRISSKWCFDNKVGFGGFSQSEYNSVCKDSVSRCGDGETSPDEDIGCDLGGGLHAAFCNSQCLFNNVSHQKCVPNSPGCDKNGQYLGSSLLYATPSVCGDGTRGTGEELSCESNLIITHGAAGNLLTDPWALAVGVGLGVGAGVPPVQSSTISAVIPTTPFSGDGQFVIPCGYETDADCAAFGVNYGVGADSCCYAKPTVIGTTPADSAGGVCLNSALQVSFNGLIDQGSLTGSTLDATSSIIIARGELGTACGAGERDVTALVMEYGIRVLEPWYEKFLTPVRRLFAWLFGLPVDAAFNPTIWCAGSDPASASVQKITASTSRVNIALQRLLAPDNPYVVFLTPGVRNTQGVSMGFVGGKNYNFRFSTGSKVCEIDRVDVTPTSWYFSSANASTILTADAKSKSGAIQPIPGSYEWFYKWGPEGNTSVTVPPNSTAGTVNITSLNKNGEVDVRATAEVTVSNLLLSATGTVASGSSHVTVFLCENPWPPKSIGITQIFPYSDSAGNHSGFSTSTSFFNGSTIPASDAGVGDGYYNFSTYYCADNASFGTLDDRPYLRPSVTTVAAKLRLDHGSCEVTGDVCTQDSECTWGVSLIDWSFETPNFRPDESRLIDATSTDWWRTTAAGRKILVFDDGSARRARQYIALGLSSVYQDIVTIPGTTFRWGFDYRGFRNTGEKIQVSIGVPGGVLVGQLPGGGLNNVGNNWGVINGEYTVPAGQNITRFSLDGVASAGNAPEGNQVDGVYINPVQLSCFINSPIKRFLFTNEKNGDAIGIQVFPNSKHLSPMEWYSSARSSGGQGFQGPVQSTVIGGYPAASDGNNIYVGGLNVAPPSANATTNNLYDVIYLFSVDTNATKETKDVFEDLMKNLHFNTNLTNNDGYCGTSISNPLYVDKCVSDLDCPSGQVCAAQVSKLQRNYSRVNDLKSFDVAIQSYRRQKNAYPELTAGSYLSGQSVSTWPSWSKLGSDLGSALPTDPINKLGTAGTCKFAMGVMCATDGNCPAGDQCVLHDPETGWSIADARFSFACATSSLAYRYAFSTSTGYTVSSNFEDPGVTIGNLNNFIDGFAFSNISLYPGLGIWSDSPNSTGICETNQDIVSNATGECGDMVRNILRGEQCESTVLATTFNPPNPFTPQKKTDKSQCTLTGGNAIETTCDVYCHWGTPQTKTCAELAICGNGTLETGEICDEGSSLNGTYNHCAANCSGLVGTPPGYCGNNNLETPAEVCDPGAIGATKYATLQSQSCAASCEAYGPFCGDGSVYLPNENCDAGTALNGIVCSPNGVPCTYCSNTCQNVTVQPPACVYTYSAWGVCAVDASGAPTQSRTLSGSPTPSGCVGNPVLVQSCAICNYTYNYGSCAWTNIGTIWEQTLTVISQSPVGCSGTPLTSQSCLAPACNYTYTSGACEYSGSGSVWRIPLSNPVADQQGCVGTPLTSQPCSAPTCTSFTYTTSTCNYTGSGTVWSQALTNPVGSPVGCVGGSPATSQPCAAPTCTSFTYTAGTCTYSGSGTIWNQSLTVASSIPTGCTGGTPLTTQTCVAPSCTYTYTPGTCTYDGTSWKQTPTVASASPTGCTGTPVLTPQPCAAPACTYTYSAWSACQVGTGQTRTYTASPTGCAGTPVTTQTCCGDGTKNGTEFCDAGASNGVVCTPPYNASCTYCNTGCAAETTVPRAIWCGDGIVNGPENCEVNVGCTFGTLNGIKYCNSATCTWTNGGVCDPKSGLSLTVTDDSASNTGFKLAGYFLYDQSQIQGTGAPAKVTLAYLTIPTLVQTNDSVTTPSVNSPIGGFNNPNTLKTNTQVNGVGSAAEVGLTSGMGLYVQESWANSNKAFSYINGVAAGSNGNVYVADSSNSRIEIFNSAGTFIRGIGYGTTWTGGAPAPITGSGNGFFNLPNGIAVDGGGNIYVADSGNHRIQIFNSSGVFLRGIGNGSTWTGGTAAPAIASGSNNNPYLFSSPQGIAVKADGSLIYLADTGGHRISIFNSSGVMVRSFGGGVIWTTGQPPTSFCGTANGHFCNPYGVAVDSAGNIYVADSTNHRIQVHNSSGTFVRGIGNGTIWTGAAPTPAAGTGNWFFGGPTGVAVDSAGNIYVADTNNQRIQAINFDGSFQSGGIGNGITWTTGSMAPTPVAGRGNGSFSWPAGVAVDPLGNIYVADTNNFQVQRFDQSWAWQSSWGYYGIGGGQYYQPFRVALDSSGDIYVADTFNDRIQKLNSSGVWLATYGSSGTGDGQFRHPYGVTVDSLGNIYVADTDNHRIQVLDSAGGWAFSFGTYGTADGEFAFPGGIDIDSFDNIYVTDIGNHRIQKFDFKGRWLATYGSEGEKNGMFKYPYGVTIDSAGNIIVADTHNFRVQILDSSGVFIRGIGNGTTWTGDAPTPAIGVDSAWFNFLASVDVDTAGNIYVADNQNSRIQIFNSSGVFVRGIGNGTTWTGAAPSPQIDTRNGYFNAATSVAVDPSGNIYAADYGNHRIQKMSIENLFSSSGIYTSHFDSGLTSGGWTNLTFTKGSSAGNVNKGSVRMRVKASSSGTAAPVFSGTGNCDTTVSADGAPAALDIFSCAGTGRYLWYEATLSSDVDQRTGSSLKDVFVLPTNSVVQTITASGAGNWVVPEGVTSVMVEAWGGGGGGGWYTGSGGGGGGGGAYARLNALSVAPGSSIPYSVGVGGSGATTGNHIGGNGGVTTFNTNSVVADSGKGGRDDTSYASGGTVAASSGDVKYAGGRGASYLISSSNSGGGGGSAGSASNGNDAPGFQGAAAVLDGGPGGNCCTGNSPASGPGGGGGAGGSSANGAAGSAGQLRITYFLPYTPNNYIASGHYASGHINPGPSVTSWGNISWNSTLTAGQSITMYARSANNSSMSGATGWCSITSGGAVPAGCLPGGNTYMQFDATLINGADNTLTPSLNDLTMTFSGYDRWIGGPCGATNLEVYNTDLASTYAWKTSITSCVGPQCSGSPAVLVADNAVDFSAYPARDACKAIGGRLPTLTELACIYTNRARYNAVGAFQSGFFWSATEFNATDASVITFSDGGQNNSTKTYAGNPVRCVRGQ